MAGAIITTAVGNLVADPELRQTTKGLSVASFTVASSERRFDAESGEWQDGDASFMRCQVWRDYADNLAASLHKGDRVIVTGRLVQEQYETKDGQKRSSWQLEVDDVGPALRFVRATVVKIAREKVPA